MQSIVLNKMLSEKKKIFETFFCSEVSVFTALTVGCCEDQSNPRDTLTRTIRHNDSTQERYHFVTIQLHRVGLSSYPQTSQFDPSKVGTNIFCDILTHESAVQKTYPILCSIQSPVGQCRTPHTDGAHKKRHCATKQKFTNTWFSQVCALT